MSGDGDAPEEGHFLATVRESEHEGPRWRRGNGFKGKLLAEGRFGERNPLRGGGGIAVPLEQCERSIFLTGRTCRDPVAVARGVTFDAADAEAREVEENGRGWSGGLRLAFPESEESHRIPKWNEQSPSPAERAAETKEQ